jgi:hypothetical protein
MTIPPQNSAGQGEVTHRSSAGQLTASTVWWLSPPIARLMCFAILLLGVQAWLIMGRGYWGTRYQVLLLPAALFAGFIPSIRNLCNRLWLALSRPGLPARIAIALLLSIACAFYLFVTARDEGIPLNLKYQDEFSYMIQTRMLAEGHLFLPSHPCADFFDTIYVLAHPVYASMYFPGAALMFVPTVWLHLPYYAGPLAASGLAAGALYLVIAEVLDGASGLLAVLLLLSLWRFRMLSIMMMSQPPALCLGLIMTFAWLRWRINHHWGWALLGGAASGWAVITRPADALCFAVVLLVPTVMDWYTRPGRLSELGKSAVVAILAAAPFLGLQLKFNHEVTGEWLKSPFTLYTEQFYPGIGFGFGNSSAPDRHVSDLPQKQMLYDRFSHMFQHPHRWVDIPSLFMQRLQFLLSDGILDSIAFLWFFLPLSLLALPNRLTWAVWGTFPVFLLIYTGYAFFLPHYFTTVFPAIVILLVLPIRVLSDAFPKRQATVRTSLGLATIALAVVSLPQFDILLLDQPFRAAELQRINQKLAQDVVPPAVVMFHFNFNTMMDGKPHSDAPELEPVYNFDVAWPDDAPIIRAHDRNVDISAVGKRGDRDLALYEYYLRVDPRRVFYLYDRHIGGGRLTRLGTAAEMVQKTQ